jgi:hypothetical protein
MQHDLLVAVWDVSICCLHIVCPHKPELHENTTCSKSILFESCQQKSLVNLCALNHGTIYVSAVQHHAQSARLALYFFASIASWFFYLRGVMVVPVLICTHITNSFKVSFKIALKLTLCIWRATYSNLSKWNLMTCQLEDIDKVYMTTCISV